MKPYQKIFKETSFDNEISNLVLALYDKYSSIDFNEYYYLEYKGTPVWMVTTRLNAGEVYILSGSKWIRISWRKDSKGYKSKTLSSASSTEEKIYDRLLFFASAMSSGNLKFTTETKDWIDTNKFVIMQVYKGVREIVKNYMNTEVKKLFSYIEAG